MVPPLSVRPLLQTALPIESHPVRATLGPPKPPRPPEKTGTTTGQSALAGAAVGAGVAGVTFGVLALAGVSLAVWPLLVIPLAALVGMLLGLLAHDIAEQEPVDPKGLILLLLLVENEKKPTSVAIADKVPPTTVAALSPPRTLN